MRFNNRVCIGNRDDGGAKKRMREGKKGRVVT